MLSAFPSSDIGKVGVNCMIQLRDNEFIKLVQFIKDNYGINLESKRHLIEGRLGNLVTARGFETFDEYFNYIFKKGEKDEIITLLNKLTTNHTFFMREEEHFKFFKNKILPDLREKTTDRDLRIWSAGCSSGEEPYMLAILLQEFFENQAYLWDKKILATDICKEVLEKAKKGIYLNEDVDNIDISLRNRYFKRVDADSYQINDFIKNEVIYRVFNLMESFPFKRKFHVIFCRNVMIYFDQETKNRLIRKFYDMTEDGGYLFIGMSESIRREDTDYTIVMPSVYRKE